MHPQAVWPNAFSIPNVWAFDLVSYSWSSLPDLPDHRAGGGAAVLGTQLHFFGGGQSRPWSEVSGAYCPRLWRRLRATGVTGRFCCHALLLVKMHRTARHKVGGT